MKRLPHILRPLLWTLLFTALGLAFAVYAMQVWHQTPLRPGNLRLERPWAGLLAIGALLVLAARGWLNRLRAPRLLFSRGRNLAALGQSSWRKSLHDALIGMRAATVALIAAALMGPQSIHARDTTEVQGIDIVLTLDMSWSMQAADIRPNRFAATQAVVDDFILRRPNDRIGAVVFGRDAYTLLPLTTDHESLRSMISELSLGMVEARGTAIGNAIGVSLNRLRNSRAKSKVVILLTDGDSNSGNVSPNQAAEFAKALKVKVYTVLMGSSSDALVQHGTDIFGRPLFDRGSFPIRPELLKKVATVTGGEAFQVTDREGLERSFHTILDRLQKSEIEDVGRIYGELFTVLLAPALLLVVLELLLGTLVLRRWP